ncbi:peptidoglycan-associated lipoprotein Pal [Rhodoblastus acidophilus]|jgi:peptidoglycan-associated lipoprotein|uniref:Peptidoglycan-associated protein n=1 Tax=Rhodoblastus acidophilus TaxID=1074 RepID=A0A6N8DLJ5_RHOAC|nr:peptidoglycan-associated lipoprotein Pal [Rhodoblastus acidophilus]MCW2273154.1 peptidoglycan-associated lipoprotein [Rhodoblastus acidophilus]MTV30051.1 peptidoglycan-associated lipoprotein Pal [Rhodoblastus acidophilus]
MNISMHQLKLAGVIAVAVALGACSKNPTDLDGLNGSGAGRSGVGGVGAAGAASPGSTQDFVVNVGDRIFFDSDSSEINGSGQATLDKQARWLNQYASYAFTVEGHADERGTREYNFALGARRAEATKNYLISRGVSAARIKTISYGKERPVAVCDDISCWSQNRRAVTVLKPGA